MAAEQNLITKGSLEEIRTAETILSDNLSAHANASLSKAHGIIFYNLPHPTYDANGNDLSVYCDSHGDVVGTQLMRLTYNRINYYVPIQSSTLPGKDPGTGITPDVTVAANLGLAIPGGTAWVTDFTQAEQEDLLFTNDTVLLPHTQLSHWETHTGGIYQIAPQIVTDSAGHRVSNYIARFLVDGSELWLPCDIRSNGPIQPVRVAFPAITTLQGSNANYCAMGRDGGQYGYFWYNPIVGGELPATFTWQYNSYLPPSYPWWSNPLVGSGTWYDINMSPGTYQLLNNPVTAYSTVTGPNKLTIQTNTGSDNQVAIATIRGKWTNAVGTVYTNWCIFVANDQDGSWIFSDPDFNQSATYVNITNDPTWVDGYYTPPGPP